MDINQIVDILWKFIIGSPVIMLVVQAIKAIWKNRPQGSSIWLALAVSLGSAGYLAYTTPVAPGVEVWLHWLVYMLAGGVLGTGAAIGLFEGVVGITSNAVDRKIDFVDNQPTPTEK